ncbi:MAG: hypothetical protein II551_00130 [Paludibacteraceae bacterium]|nr:hypothetical protein [Paludibacteraceae bacterium]
MKPLKITACVLLGASAIAIAVMCVTSVITPIKFEETRMERQDEVVKNLVALRTAELEFRNQRGCFTDNLDSLILFLKTTPKKEIVKMGSLTEKQLEAGMTEEKANEIFKAAKARVEQKDTVFESDSAKFAYIWATDKQMIDAGLQGFARDTLRLNMLQAVFKGEYNEENIADICIIPHSGGKKFEVKVNNDYTTASGTHVPLFAIFAPFETFLGDLDAQELVNLIDQETKLEHYPGLKVGDVEEPNNYAGNWE